MEIGTSAAFRVRVSLTPVLSAASSPSLSSSTGAPTSAPSRRSPSTVTTCVQASCARSPAHMAPPAVYGPGASKQAGLAAAEPLAPGRSAQVSVRSAGGHPEGSDQLVKGVLGFHMVRRKRPPNGVGIRRQPGLTGPLERRMQHLVGRLARGRRAVSLGDVRMQVGAPLRCGISGHAEPDRQRSDRLSKFGERHRDPQPGTDVDCEFVVTAAQILHKGVPGDHDLR